MFPTRVIAEESATASRVLVDQDCMMPRDNDPNMATPVGSTADVGSCMARFEFKGLEFARPTRMVRCPASMSQIFRRVTAACT